MEKNDPRIPCTIRSPLSIIIHQQATIMSNSQSTNSQSITYSASAALNESRSVRKERDAKSVEGQQRLSLLRDQCTQSIIDALPSPEDVIRRAQKGHGSVCVSVCHPPMRTREFING